MSNLWKYMFCLMHVYRYRNTSVSFLLNSILWPSLKQPLRGIRTEHARLQLHFHRPDDNLSSGPSADSGPSATCNGHCGPAERSFFKKAKFGTYLRRNPVCGSSGQHRGSFETVELLLGFNENAWCYVRRVMFVFIVIY